MKLWTLSLLLAASLWRIAEKSCSPCILPLEQIGGLSSTCLDKRDFEFCSLSFTDFLSDLAVLQWNCRNMFKRVFKKRKYHKTDVGTGRLIASCNAGVRYHSTSSVLDAPVWVPTNVSGKTSEDDPSAWDTRMEFLALGFTRNQALALWLFEKWSYGWKMCLSLFLLSLSFR